MKRLAKLSLQGKPIEAVQPAIGENHFMQSFSGKEFPYALKELIKNSIGWGATHIDVTLFVDKAAGIKILRIFDNGVGMDKTNRDAFVSLGKTKASLKKSAAGDNNIMAIFCTGSKSMLCSFAHSVMVFTLPRGEKQPIGFEVNAGKLYDALVTRSHIIACVELHREEWLYDCPSGTMLDYIIRPDQMRKVPSEEKIAEQILQLFPRSVASMITVGGKPLPPRKLMGEYVKDIDDLDIGKVSIDLYRPDKKGKDEGLYFAIGSVGEVPVSSFLKAIGVLGSMVSEVYLHKECCGVIAAEFLRDYINENRITFRPDLEDDPRTERLLKILSDLSLAVGKSLSFEIREKSDSFGEDAALYIEDIVHSLAQVYNPEGKKPAHHEGASATGGSTYIPPDREYARKPLKLVFHQEYEFGEQVDIHVEFQGPKEKWPALANSLEWTLTHAQHLEMKYQRISSGIRLMTKPVGSINIRAILPGIAEAKGSLTIVPQRELRLNCVDATVSVGASFPLMALNSDKASGELSWILDGPGTLIPSGARAMYSATEEGSAVVVVHDTHDPSLSARAILTTKDTRRNLLPIRNQWFVWEVGEFGPGTCYYRPVNIFEAKDGRLHKVSFNRIHEQCIAAKEKGFLTSFLQKALILEWAHFSRLIDKSKEMGIAMDAANVESPLELMDPRDYRDFMDSCNTLFLDVMVEMLH